MKRNAATHEHDFRSGCAYHRGAGRIFYFRPGHETYRIFFQDEIQTVIKNAIRWAAPVGGPTVTFGHFPEPLQDVTPFTG